jgi:hypothetical protein
MTDDEETYQRFRIAVTTAMARGICRSFGPKPDCLCAGAARNCIAVNLYKTEAAATFIGVEQAGYMILSAPPPLSIDRLEEAMAEALGVVEERLEPTA